LNLDLKYAADFELWLRFFRYAELYSLKSLLSGFRFRSGNQVSLDNRSAYINEVQVAISEELARLPEVYVFKLQEIQNFKTRLNSFSNRISRSIYFRRNHSRIMQYEKELFQYPQRIGFDWVTQQFQMND
jgi:hypothetical protein